MRFLTLLLVLLAAHRRRSSATLIAWAMKSRGNPGDGHGRDFLAIFDLGVPSQFGRLVTGGARSEPRDDGPPYQLMDR